MLKANNKEVSGKTVVVTGSGNVAIYAAEKAMQLGAKVIALCDSAGYIYDENGVNLDVIKEIKEVRRERISEYVKKVPNAIYTEGKGIWNLKCDIYLPCATQNELDLEAVKVLVSNGCFAVAEGANMPTTLEATNYLIEKLQMQVEFLFQDLSKAKMQLDYHGHLKKSMKDLKI